ncbi:MAG: type IV toxin-antitoxin system AbiEi family antitoxin [Deltaproteobacteria bacterium]|nr:type IV toxin-antitoxin system AbiEi family antitoxin [Deltaproteobacteria bacterium]
MSTKSIHSRQYLKKALFTLPQGMPVTSSHLEQWGISRQLAHRYVLSGWLESLGYGYYVRMGDSLTVTGAVTGLEMQGVAVHIGGKSALSLRGAVHYLAQGKERLSLYGVTKKRLPPWFVRRFPCEARRSRLFKEEDATEKRLYVRHLEEKEPHSPFVSEPERALLEMLEGVPQKQTTDEAHKIMEPLYTLRPEAVQTLLEACTKIKVKRLFFSIADGLKLPVLKHLDLSGIDFGAPSVYILTKKGGALILKHPMAAYDE